jgi:hypothetical protein
MRSKLLLIVLATLYAAQLALQLSLNSASCAASGSATVALPTRPSIHPQAPPSAAVELGLRTVRPHVF